MKPGYKVQYRRRRKGKTDFRKRRELLIGRKSRLVVRKSLNNLRVQVVDYTPKGDIVLASAFSKELEKLGWKYKPNNLPGSYLTGLLCGTRALKSNCKEAILDLGLNEPIYGSKLYAALKGVVDSGMQIPLDEKVFPKEERLRGDHIAQYKKDFADIPKKFEDMKQLILSGKIPEKAKTPKKSPKPKKTQEKKK